MERVLVNKSLILSNCLIEALKIRLTQRCSAIGWDFNSPSGGISFYCDTIYGRHRFRRKIFKRSNKSKILFIGYNIVISDEN